jgi:hypothetical protein
MIQENVLVSEYVKVPGNNTSSWYVAEGQFLHEKQILTKAKSQIYRAGIRRPTISERGQNIGLRVRRGEASIYVKCAIFSPRKQENSSNGPEERND